MRPDQVAEDITSMRQVAYRGVTGAKWLLSRMKEWACPNYFDVTEADRRVMDAFEDIIWGYSRIIELCDIAKDAVSELKVTGIMEARNRREAIYLRQNPIRVFKFEDETPDSISEISIDEAAEEAGLSRFEYIAMCMEQERPDD